ncbi:MAG: YqaA family protein [Dehalococcoidia bacterium]|jgi:membrane protein YqaA with SNARE-associated domain
MEWFNDINLWFESFAETDWAIVALIVGTFLESLISPIPPDPLLIAMGVLQPSMAIYFSLIATIASVSGALLGHWIGSKYGRVVLKKFVSDEKILVGEKLFDQYGVWAILLAAITPIPYKVFAVLAGVLKLDVKRFLIASIIGRGIRYLVIGILLYFLGEDIKILMDDYFDNLTLLIIIGFIGSIVVIWLAFKFKFFLPTSND